MTRAFNAADFKVGDKVHYVGFRGQDPENGIVKSKRDKDEFHVFVVYKCNDDWKNYQNYTGVRTACSELRKGWL